MYTIAHPRTSHLFLPSSLRPNDTYLVTLPTPLVLHTNLRRALGELLLSLLLRIGLVALPCRLTANVLCATSVEHHMLACHSAFHCRVHLDDTYSLPFELYSL